MKYSEMKSKSPIALFFLNIMAFILVLNYTYGMNNPNNIVLYTDSDCGFCEETIDEIEFREYSNHIDLSIKSLKGNSLNKRGFDNSIEKCGIPEDQKGVPLLVAKNICFKGKTEILKELERLSIQN
ncbi:MAG TPA: hypothetical protein PLS49_07460 [Candidatus Woesebacteria bacterium]|nr:hypothetical protein [Candidatus Woesebacteria bacterium]